MTEPIPPSTSEASPATSSAPAPAPATPAVPPELPPHATIGSPPPASSVVGPVTNMVRWLSDSLSLTTSSARLRSHLEELLGQSTLFNKCTKEQRARLADLYVPFSFRKGEVLMLQGEAQESAIVVVEGQVVRQRLVGDQMHVVSTLGSTGSRSSVGTLHLLRRERTYATVKAVSDGVAFRIQASDLEKFLREDPDMSLNVINSLTSELRIVTQATAQQTPLFLQQGRESPREVLPWFAVTCAAGVESFYRSAMNSLINAAVSGGERGALFPNMHIQVPTRIMYINGFKGLRWITDHNVDLMQFQNPQLAGAALATFPGIVMCPISSVLEASNAGHRNPEPLSIRWTRGYVPRTVREVIFGVGINQLSDFYEERLPMLSSNSNVQALAGSFTAGLVCGYLSHVPHSLSALKLLQPDRSYKSLFKDYTKKWDERIHEKMVSPKFRPWLVNGLSCLFPKGVLVRSAQIAGSFVIINTTMTALRDIQVEVKRSDSSS